MCTLFTLKETDTRDYNLKWLQLNIVNGREVTDQEEIVRHSVLFVWAVYTVHSNETAFLLKNIIRCEKY